MTKKLVLLACIATMTLGASAQTGTSSSRGPWKNAPKSHSVAVQDSAATASRDDLTRKVGPNTHKGIGPKASKSKVVGRK